MEMQWVAPTMIELTLIVLVIMLAVWVLTLALKVKSAHQLIQRHQQQHAEKLTAAETTVRNVVHQQNEDQARSLVVTRHIQALQKNLDDIENQIRELKLQDPSLRLYQRAAELVKQGASIEEVMEACDIPRAEAEMLSMVHRQTPNQA